MSLNESNSAAQTKILMIGGKQTGSCELAQEALDHGAYLIVADYLPKEQSPAKRMAHECWDCSTADVGKLKDLCEQAGVTGVVAGVHEFNTERMAELAISAGLKCYCTPHLLQECVDKREFKQWCQRFGIHVAHEYGIEEAKDLEVSSYPLAVKPLDGNSSCGFTKCLQPTQLDDAIEEARNNSDTKQVLIEEFVDADAVIIHYTASNGEIVFSGVTDKASKKMGEHGAPIMALQIAPSIHQDQYLREVDVKAKEMLTAMGFEEGPIWIEAFYKDGRFIFNEIGFRFGASLTYKLVHAMYGIDQLGMMVEQAMGVNRQPPQCAFNQDAVYAIWPMHLKAGTIAAIRGVDELEGIDGFESLSFVHHPGDEIEEWGSARQVLGYVHLKASSIMGIVNAMKQVMETLVVEDESGASMLMALLDPENADKLPSFVRQRLA